MPYLGSFDEKCLIWVFLGKNFKKLASYLKLAASNFSNCKVFLKKKNTYILHQNVLIWVFSDWNLKTILSYLKSAPSSLPNLKTGRKNKSA